MLLTQTRDGSRTVLAADAAACLLPKFCLAVNRAEIYREIELSVISVGVNDGRDFRVVIDVVLGLVTCGVVELAVEGTRDRTT